MCLCETFSFYVYMYVSHTCLLNCTAHKAKSPICYVSAHFCERINSWFSIGCAQCIWKPISIHLSYSDTSFVCDACRIACFIHDCSERCFICVIGINRLRRNVFMNKSSVYLSYPIWRIILFSADLILPSQTRIIIIKMAGIVYTHTHHCAIDNTFSLNNKIVWIFTRRMKGMFCSYKISRIRWFQLYKIVLFVPSYRFCGLHLTRRIYFLFLCAQFTYYYYSTPKRIDQMEMQLKKVNQKK